MRIFIVAVIAAASLVDALLTDFGIRRGFIEEANPLMDWLYRQSSELFILVKLALPALLLVLLPVRLSRSIRGLLIAAGSVYVFALSMHTVWLAHFWTFI